MTASRESIARRWCEGLKRTLAQRGYSLAGEDLTLETFGSWSGCHHKYSNFFAAYLGARRPALRHAETDLCTHKGMPMDVAEFVECVELARHVLLFIFRREDGLPMAQFWDGLRPVWEPTHTASVAIDQVRRIVSRVDAIVARHPEAAAAVSEVRV